MYSVSIMFVNMTPKQKKVYDFIESFYQEKGYSPTLVEIAKKLGKTVPTIHQYVEALIKKEYLHKTKGTVRNIIPVSANPSAKTVIQRKLNIGVIGYGMVGQAVSYGFSNSNVLIYDKFKESDTLEKVVRGSDYLFICLPTPIKSDESGIDLSIINKVVKKNYQTY